MHLLFHGKVRVKFTAKKRMNRHIYEGAFLIAFTQAESHCKSRMKIQNPFTKALAYKENNDILLQPVDLAKK